MTKLLGANFIRKDKITCNYGIKEVHIGKFQIISVQANNVKTAMRNNHSSYRQSKYDRCNTIERSITRRFYWKLPSSTSRIHVSCKYIKYYGKRNGDTSTSDNYLRNSNQCLQRSILRKSCASP